jgi:YegS/Rv2252/BmrU family lipid kinase
MAGMTAGYGTRLLVVTNAAAGRGGDAAVRAALGVLRQEADVRVGDAAGPDDVDRLLDGLDDRTLVVAGGDGSLHVIIGRLLARGELTPDRPIGIVPLGTGNDLARTLGLPLEPVEAARAVLRGRPRSLDLLVDDTGAVVVNVVHLGVGAEAAQKAVPLKDRLGMTAFTVGSVAAGARPGGWEVRVAVDGRVLPLEGEVLMVAVANGRTIGGGAELAPDASPDDGFLDVVVVMSGGPVARIGFGVSLREGEHVGRDDVIVVRGTTVAVAGEEMPVNADGELGGVVSSRSWSVRPAAWSVLVP